MSDPIRDLHYDQAEGRLSIGPLRYLLVRPELLAEIQKGLEDRLGAKSAEYLYAAGSSWAAGALRRLAAAPADEPQDLVHALCRHASGLGWGRWELAGWEPDKQSLGVRVSGSPFARAYGQSDQPVCHLISGAVAGLTEALFRVPATCSEHGCVAQGDPDCFFVATGHDLAAGDSWGW